MGQYLSSPVTTKEVKEGHNDRLAYGLAAMQGWRIAMEDDHVSALNFHDHLSLFSVFDGHGGKAVAKYCARHIIPEIKKLEAFKQGDLAKAITDVYFKLDHMLDSEDAAAELTAIAGEHKSKAPAGGGGGLFSTIEHSLTGSSDQNKDAAAEEKELEDLGSSKEFYDSHLRRVSLEVTRSGDVTAGSFQDPPPADVDPPAPQQEQQQSQPDTNEDPEELIGAHGMGCTAVSVLIKDNQLIVANTGDSRCVLSQKGIARPLTLDHKPVLLEESQRIVKAGGFVRDNRVNGALNVSRTIGDLDFKRNEALPHTEQMVVATPDIEIVQLMEGDEFLILACDGIWDVLSNQEAVEFVRKRIKQGLKLKQICEHMCDYCLAPDLKGLCRGADNMSVIIVVFKKHAKLDSPWSRFWGSATRALGLGPPKQKQTRSSG